MKHELKRIAVHVITIAALSGVLGVLLAEGPHLLDAWQRGALSPRTAMLIFTKGWKLSLDIAGIAALLALVFLRAVPLPRAACWVAGGMIGGGLLGAGLAWPSEIRAWVVAYTIGGMVCGLVAASVRVWGAERASRGFPVRVGTLLTK